MDSKYSGWRVFTPILLVVITVLGGVVSYLVVDKLNAMNDKSDKLFTIVGGVKSSFEGYQITAENRFTKLETELSDISIHVRP